MTTTPPPRAGRVLTVLAWAIAAVVAGTLAWWAVTLVGAAAGRSRDGVLSAPEVAEALAAEQAAASATPSGSISTPDATPGTTPGPTASTPGPGTASPTDPAAAEVSRTWDVIGGQVAATCAGPTISLLYATPTDGWRVEVKDSGGEHVEVEFRRGEAETKVRATCVDGVPEAVTESDD